VVNAPEADRALFEVSCRLRAAARLLDDHLTTQVIDPALSAWGARANIAVAERYLESLVAPGDAEVVRMAG
jgi:hypothetical protein